MKISFYYIILLLMNYITALPQQTELRPITVEWEKTFGGNAHDFGATVYPTQDGGYIVGGDTKSFGAGSRDILLIKTNSSGNKMWQKTYGGSKDEYIHGSSGLIETSDGGFIICGVTTSFGSGMMDFYLIKTNNSGDLEWEKFYGGKDDEDPLSILEIENRNYIVAGCTKSFGAGDRDIFLVKVDSDGNKMWETTLGGIGFDATVCIDTISNDEFIVCGETKNYGNGGKDIYLVKCMEIR